MTRIATASDIALIARLDAEVERAQAAYEAADKAAREARVAVEFAETAALNALTFDDLFDDSKPVQTEDERIANRDLAYANADLRCAIDLLHLARDRRAEAGRHLI